MCNPLKERFDEWKDWLLGDDVHSISKQIHSMMWDSTVYQSINESRAYAATDAEGQIELNSMVHHFIDKCFFETQMMAIRRLLDRETRHGDRSVISLWRLLSDMEKHASLLTRENILACLDLPYDYEKAREDILKRYPDTNGVKVMGDDYKQCSYSEYAHRCIDTLADANALQRSSADAVRMAVVQWIKERLEKCMTIREYVNKFLAHPATPESRARVLDEETKITLGLIFDAHEIICQIAEFVGQNMFLRSIGNPLPTLPFDQFQHFEKPWVTEETLKTLHEWWRSYRVSTDNWLKWNWQAELPACP